MANRFKVKYHPKREAIEVYLAAGVCLTDIAARFNVSRFSAARYRDHLKRTDRRRFFDLRRAALAEGIKRKALARPANEAPCRVH